MIWVRKDGYCDFCCSANGAKRQSSRRCCLQSIRYGIQNTIIINSSWGLGENIVKGTVTPDEWMVFKPTTKIKLESYPKSIVAEELQWFMEQSKETSAENTTINNETPIERQNQFS
jgi:pyruvate,water dikinase